MPFARCPGCGVRLRIPAFGDGATVRCLSCLQEFRVTTGNGGHPTLSKYVEKGMGRAGRHLFVTLDAAGLLLAAAFIVMLRTSERIAPPDESGLQTASAEIDRTGIADPQPLPAEETPLPAEETPPPVGKRNAPAPEPQPVGPREEDKPEDLGDETPFITVIQEVVVLKARDARVQGRRPTAKYETEKGKDNIGFWTKAADRVSWDFDISVPGRFAVDIQYACPKTSSGSTYEVVIGAEKLQGTVKSTDNWDTYRTERLGTIRVDQPGRTTLSVRPIKKPRLALAVMNLKSVTLLPISSTPPDGSHTGAP